MLLASENVQSLLYQNAGVDISFCYWLLVVAAVLVPLSWLGTPKDFWLVHFINNNRERAQDWCSFGLALHLH